MKGTLKKNTGVATGGAEAVTGDALWKKVFLQILQISQENTCVGVFFYEVASLQPASFLKRDSNTSALLWSLQNF